MPETGSKVKDEIVEKLKGLVGPMVAEAVERNYAELRTKHAQELGITPPDPGVPPPIARARDGKAKDERTAVTKSGVFGQIIRAVGRTKGNPDAALELIKREQGEHSPAYVTLSGSAEIAKSVASSDSFNAGGAWVVGDYALEYIDLLVPRVAVRALRPTLVPMPSGTFSIPTITADPSGAWVGENSAPAVGSVGTGARRLTAKKHSILVPFSNDLSRRTDARADQYIERLAVRRGAIDEDLAFLRGSGTVYTPKGLRAQAKTTTPVTATGGSKDFVHALADLGTAVETLAGSNVMMIAPGWIMSTRSQHWLMFQAVNALGVPYFLEEMRGGTLLGFPFAPSNNVPNNLGSGADSEILLADFDQVMLGETLALQVTTSQEASYDAGGGVQVSSFGNDQTLLRIIEEVDLGVEHEEAVTYLTGVQWGA